MSLLKLVGVGDVQAPEVHPEGRVPLCILEAKETEKDGHTNVRIMLEIEDPHPVAGKEWAVMFHYLNPPQGDDDEEKVKNKLRMAKQFLIQFNIPILDDDIDLATFAGSRADGNITIEEYNGASSNKLKCDPLPRD